MSDAKCTVCGMELKYHGPICTAGGSFAPPAGSGAADRLMIELRSLAGTDYPLCPEARLLLEMAVDVQQGKSIDVARLLPNTKLTDPAP